MDKIDQIIIDNSDAKDSAYKTIADTPHFQQSRDYVEQLWAEFSDSNCVDKKFKTQIQDSFHQSFAEMYFTVAIQRLGFNIFSKNCGPDICFSDENIFIECVAPTDGETVIMNEQVSDKIPKIASFNDDLVISRYTSSICAKYEKFQEYIGLDKYSLSCDSVNIIALNGSGVSENRYNIGAPRILKALFPIGYPALYRSGNSDLQSTTPKPSILNNKDVEIQTNLFVDHSSSLISAVIYSEVCAFNKLIDLNKIGSDLILVHNPMARNPLRKGFIGKGLEYSLIDKNTLTFNVYNHNTEKQSTKSYG